MSKHLDGPFDKDWVGRFNFVVVSECVWSYGCTQIVCELLQLQLSTIKETRQLQTSKSRYNKTPLITRRQVSQSRSTQPQGSLAEAHFSLSTQLMRAHLSSAVILLPLAKHFGDPQPHQFIDLGLKKHGHNARCPSCSKHMILQMYDRLGKPCYICIGNFGDDNLCLLNRIRSEDQ